MIERTTLEPRYFERMARSIGDKVRLLEWVLPGRVADIGAGGGDLSLALGGLDDVHTVFALDDSDDALELLTDVPGVTAVRGSFGEALEALPGGQVDTIVCSSVMHEVYSYGGGWAAIDLALESAWAALRPGGRLVIRDGVMPEAQGCPVRMWTPDNDLAREYAALTPHPELQIIEDADGWWVGSAHAIAEALLTLTWGRGSLAREAQERYQLATESEYRLMVEPHGFTQIHSESYTLPGYRDHLRQYRVESAQDPNWFPLTNAVWVFEKVDRASL
ncbi:methyltransferase [Leucobacter sp. cx-169]|uniref:methyltransferase n=1 Tax=Leucobacter sp. cx-169 TaxID=2770549 RepID=UPI00165E9041|nr:methyltransferase [Leucobacter sp. cx-169]MBC9927251.1 methyltransferase domain-containing protein [Leucobacter sp. cx-169]